MKTVDQDIMDDLNRWFIGHQLFFVQIQTLIVLLHQFDNAPSEECLDQITATLLGSAVTMEYTADFTGAGYAPVRDSMEEHDPNFSGTYSADHAAMIRLFPKLIQAKGLFPDAHVRFGVALQKVYEAHAQVCDRFTQGGVSLANENSVAWQTIVQKFLPRAMKKAGFDDAEMKSPWPLGIGG